MAKYLSRKSTLLKFSLLTFLIVSFCSVSAQNTALEFDGTNDYIETDYPGISGNGSRTVEAWIKAGYDSAQRFIVDMGDTGAGSGARFSFKINPGATVVRIEIGGGGINGSTTITNNQWHHVAVVYDNDAVVNKYKIYVDGALDVQSDMATPLNVVTNETHLGIGIRADLSTTTVFDGSIDEVRVWDIVRTQAEIQADMNTELCGAPNLVSYFKLNDGLANGSNTDITTVSDSSGNGYTGTLNNFSLTGGGSNFVDGPTSLIAGAIDDAVSLTETTLTADAEGVTYQWIDCDNGNMEIDGAVSQSFTPDVSGNYAVILYNGSCNITSECITVTIEADVCAIPTAIISADITENSAVISWTENGDANEWEVLYGESGFNVETEGSLLNAGTAPLTAINDLMPNTQYDVYVRAVCDDENSSEWSASATFITDEEIATGGGVALNFDGDGDYIQTDYTGVLGNGARTVEAWVKTNSGNNEQVIAAWGSDAVNGRRFTFRLANSGENDVVRIEIKGGGFNGSINVNDGNWHHVAVTYSPDLTVNKYKLYVDGQLDTEGDIAATLNSTADVNVRIGRRINPGFTGYFDGKIDEVRIWSIARSQAELAANMNNEFCSPQTNLEAYFKLNDGTPDEDNALVTLLTDSSGNGYQGTFMDFTLSGTISNFSAGNVEPVAAIDNSVSLTDATLTAVQEGAAYQWIDCDNGNIEINGATSQTFTPEITGNYAVIVSVGECTEISECIMVEVADEDLGVALNFDGVDDHVQTNYPGVAGGGARTVEAWIKTTKNSLPSNQGGMGQSVIADWGTLGTGTRFTFNVLFNNAIRLEVQGSGLSGTMPVNDGDWHHVAVVYNPSATNSVQLYVDGMLDAEGNMTTAVNTGTSTDFIIGSRIDGVNFFEGSIDEVRVWNVARSQSELQADMDSEFCNPQANLQAYFKLNDGTPEVDNTAVTIVSDSSGNDNIGTLNNFDLTTAASNFVIGNVEPIAELDNSVLVTGMTLTAAQDGAEYQWVNCDNSNIEIDGATGQSFTPGVTGNYAVIISNGVCNVMSACTEVVISVEVCEVPSDVIIADIANTTAVVTWTENGDAAAWQVLYGETGFDPLAEGVSIDVLTNPTVTLTDLTPGAVYDIYVLAACGDDDTSEWSAVTMFTTTICETPSGFTVSDITNTTAVVTWTESGDAAAWQVLYSETGFDPETEGTLIDVETEPTLTLTDLIPGTQYDVYVLAVCGDEDNSEWTDVAMFTTTICAVPSQIIITDITNTTAVVTWTENGNATAWQVLYGETGFNPQTEGMLTDVETDPTLTLAELNPGTQYDVYVLAVCADENTSEWTEVTMFTTEMCEATSNTEFSDITENSVTVMWTENGDASQWQVLYGETGFNPETEGTMETVNTNPVTTLSDLAAGTQYDVYVRAICGDDNSEWTGPVVFTTETLGTNNNSIEGFMFYPNPTTGIVKISAADTMDRVSILNLTGQTVMSAAINAPYSEINVTQLPSGMYMMQIISNGKIVSYKLIKE